MNDNLFSKNLLNSCLRDESGLAGFADSAAFPRSTAEVQHALALEQAQGCTLTIQGARTGFLGQAVPQGGCIVNLTKMDRFLAFHFDGQTGTAQIRVEAGVTLEALNRALAQKTPAITFSDECSMQNWAAYCQSKQVFFFPPNPTEASATIGGIIATGASGDHIYSYGDIKNHILSAKTVSSDGQISDGALPDFGNAHAVLTECTLKLYEMPAYTYGVFCFPAAYDQLMQLLLRLEALCGTVPGCKIASADFFDAVCFSLLTQMKDALPSIGSLPAFPPDLCCALWLTCTAQEEEALLDFLEGALGCMETLGVSAEHTMAATDARELQRLGSLRHTITEGANVQSCGFPKYLLETTLPRSRYADILTALSREAAALPFGAVLMGYAGTANLHLRLLPENAAQQAQSAQIIKHWEQVIG